MPLGWYLRLEDAWPVLSDFALPLRSGIWEAAKSGVLHDVERNSSGFADAGMMGGSGDGWIVEATRSEEVAKFAVLAADACACIAGRRWCVEATG